MSCVTGSVKVLALSVAALSASSSVQYVSVSAKDTSIHPTSASCQADKIEIPLSASLICTISTDSAYVRVDKHDIWVTAEIWEQIQVMSNTNWEIV